tara:strand:- start:406 stop:1143 length:738 start_codon:yes stop_codon:yes gene_type:complete
MYKDTRKYGYARVSTEDQDLSLQINALEKYGVDHMFSESASGKNMERKELKMVLRLMRPGDTLVVWKIDRLGRSLMGVLNVIKEIRDKDIEFVSITEQFDTTTPMGNAMLQIALVFAELERNMISERTKAGMAAAKARGKKAGRTNYILSHPKRYELFCQLWVMGRIPDGDMSYSMVQDAMNKAQSKPLMKSAASISNWKRRGWDGFDVLAADHAAANMQKLETETYADLVARSRVDLDGMEEGE